MNKVVTEGIGREFYFSEDVYSLECERIFHKNWSFVGTVNDIPYEGDFLCIKIGRCPIFVIRDYKGEVRGFHNVCRHRGTQLLKGSGNVGKTIVCGYHCWSYEITGELRSVPQEKAQFCNIEKEDFSLHKVAVGVYKGMIFVHLDEACRASFDSWINKFDSYFGPYNLEGLEEIHSVTYRAKANWKLFIENHIESYHLWYAHRNSILGLDHYRQVNYYYDGNWSFFQPTLEEGRMAEFERYIPSKVIAPSEKWFGSGDHLLFPNLGVVTGGKFVATLKAVPVSAISTDVEIRMFGIPSSEERELDERYYEKGGSSEQFNVNKEDIELCERVQEGMLSDYGGVGVFAREYEESIKFFHDRYLKDLNMCRNGLSSVG